MPASSRPAALREAEEAARAPLPPREDRRDIELFTIDPIGSLDLDQAMALARRPDGGYRVDYAIADVARLRGAGRRARCRGPSPRGHPLSAGRQRAAASARAVRGRREPAAGAGPRGEAVVVRGRGRRLVDAARRRAGAGTQRERLDYAAVQSLDAGRRRAPAAPQEIGALLQERERARGAINLPIPEQEVVLRDGTYALAYRGPLPIEDANAQISLLTGMAAAEVMLARRGPAADAPGRAADQLERLRRVADALGSCGRATSRSATSSAGWTRCARATPPCSRRPPHCSAEPATSPSTGSRPPTPATPAWPRRTRT